MEKTFRELYEEREALWLSPIACLAKNSRGRLSPEKDDPYRTCFQRDRDRIIHSKAFRRLKRKTQVFLAPLGDHYRTRLTHTLEVVQIARSISRVLRLNEDLTEAIALGHDLGHTPFGHAGERVLNELSSFGFNHAEQSLRVVDILEQRQGKKGLNLTYEVREGIRDHSKGKCILSGEPCPEGISFEALVVSLSDVIAYITHDIDDAIRAGILTTKELPQHAIKILGTTPSKQIDTMVRGVIEGSIDKQTIQIIPEIRDAIVELRTFLFEKLYPSPPIAKEINKAQRIVSELFHYLMKYPPKELHENYANTEETLERKVIDFLAGMTDEYALNTYQKLFLPSPWHT
ncbi:MAG TPA: deoxyguanosinetriphosphate triphosphohydrolase [Candidatus Hydrogenedens sp.]|nr:deoxyguanosinetriphosphate triphosphohydrolase [Candidatus Hydrogenedens sp.]HOK08537.1 deoxyguanosinetriphosphate triphosphohydrolase [Candidatus Hydrogenedens sp.]HOL19025.1 deoxyguanosinetriphosphate triphosphohydrolase [Candidatus Hydrogenedens sp.]HPP57793.1 deoxyguanosinetriphosphate triphosphohydrolase [Candidatus Hydrogenedens sp.]